MVIASVCWFCATSLMLPTETEAMSRQEEEVLGLKVNCEKQKELTKL